MPRTIDLIRASKLPSNMMQFAAKGALSVPPDENIEILVYLAKHNKVFGDLARMTLAGWDEKASLEAASNPKTAPAVLNYLISPENLRPKLLPLLVENPSVAEAELAKFAVSATHESIELMLKSSRVNASPEILKSLRSNPYLKPEQAKTIDELIKPGQSPSPPTLQSASAPQIIQGAQERAINQAQPQDQVQNSSSIDKDPSGAGEDAPDEAVSAYFTQNAAEIAGEQSKPFQPVGGVLSLFADEGSPSSEVESSPTASADASTTTASSSSSGAAAAAARAPVAVPKADPGHRDNAVQKINKLDVKGRIQLALKGNKEERSLLIRDGTKVVALAVLEAPKLSDGEVEKFALQKNVLEAVLRQIPLKRRFMKNYIVVRNLVANPRTPLDLGLGLMKHLLVQDLKNISANKEVSETVRKLALKMYKQKLDSASKK
ncbi:MAG: hypothetical protein WA859_19230 [Candidatus Sulfotelmatobacter sp.]